VEFPEKGIVAGRVPTDAETPHAKSGGSRCTAREQKSRVPISDQRLNPSHGDEYVVANNDNEFLGVIKSNTRRDQNTVANMPRESRTCAFESDAAPGAGRSCALGGEGLAGVKA